MAVQGWKSVVKKINSFNQSYPGASVVCIGNIGNSYVVAGSDEMKALFLNKPEVQSMYKEAVLAQSFEDPPVQAPTPLQEVSVGDILRTHVFDLDTGMMRSIIASAVSPAQAVFNKDCRRNFYTEENCPQWWADTEIQFQSVNHVPGGGKRLPMSSLMKLIESLQRSLSIVPSPPKKKNKTEYQSCFVYLNGSDQEQGGEQQEEEHQGGEQQGGEQQDGEQQDGEQQGGERQGGEQQDGERQDGERQGGERQGGEQQEGEQQDREQQGGEQQEGKQQETGEQQGGEQQGGEQQETGEQQEGEQQEGEPDHREQETDHSLQVKRERIHEIFMEEITLEEKCLKMRSVIQSWDDLWGLAGVIKEYLPVFKETLANEWRAQTLIDTNKKYKDFIPLSIGERTVYQSTANGNCIYNAVSIILYGNEEMAVVLKLASVLKMVDDIVPFSKYIVEEFRENTVLWVESTLEQVNAASTAEEVEYGCRQELVSTIQHPYRDGTVFHVHLLSHLLLRPIQQHCKKYQQYQQLILPPLTPPATPSAIHLVWVPANPRNA